ncbi:LysR family transcriptional regulator, partial [Mesorhizobium sp. VK22B]
MRRDYGLRPHAVECTASYGRRQLDGEKHMELHQVRYFLALASTLNFTRAAEQCNVTQPA